MSPSTLDYFKMCAMYVDQPFDNQFVPHVLV